MSLVFTDTDKFLSIVLILYDIFSMKLFDKWFNVLFFLLFIPKLDNVEPEVHAIDYVDYFVTQKKYEDREELINWLLCYKNRKI